MMNLGAMNPGAAGGPVGGGMMAAMNNGSPATQANFNASTEQLKLQLNTYIYEYFLKCGHFDIARSLLREEKFELRTRPPVKQSPGRRKDGEVNGVDGDGMDMDVKDDIPDDMPRPNPESGPQGAGFLFEWFSIFSDLYNAHRSGGKMQNNGMNLPAQYLMQHQSLQRFRESQQNQNLGRPGMINANQFAMRGNIRNGQLQRADAAKSFTPQQMQQLQQQKQQQMLQQQHMQREQVDIDMNGRPSTPGDGENGGSPSKRPRLEGQQFNGGMMPNGRPGMPGVAPQGMMIQNSFNPNMSQAQFRQNGAMAQKAMQPGMPNGMMGMANAGSPMMQGMNPGQFGEGLPMDMYNGRMAGPPMQGGATGQSGNHALADYQMQLMLLEQQNKKRLMMARAEQDSAHNRDGGPMSVGMQAVGMSPSNSRNGASPNPTEQMKRTAQLGGLPGSPAAGEVMQGRSPAGMGFMNGIPAGDFNAGMFIKENPNMMVPGNPNMRPPTSMDLNAMARQQGRLPQFQGGAQPMAQQPSQGQPQPMGTPGQRNDMPPPQAPTVNSAQRNQPSSPQSSNAPPTPSQTNKPNPKNRKTKEENAKKKPTKKSSTTAAPAAEAEPPATPTPSTPITPVHPNSFNNSGNKNTAPGMPNTTQSQAQNPAMPPNQPQIPQPDISQQNAYTEFNPEMNISLDFSTLDNPDVLENFDFDSFLNTGPDEGFAFDGGIGVGADFLDPPGE